MGCVMYGDGGITTNERNYLTHEESVEELKKPPKSDYKRIKRLKNGVKKVKF